MAYSGVDTMKGNDEQFDVKCCEAPSSALLGLAAVSRVPLNDGCAFTGVCAWARAMLLSEAKTRRFSQGLIVAAA